MLQRLRYNPSSLSSPGASLSEMMLGDAPPPSPLRRAHSHHFLFPCEPEKGVAPGATTSHAQPTAIPTPVQPSCAAEPSTSTSRCGGEKRTSCPTPEARARLESAESRGEIAPECHDRLHEAEQSAVSTQSEAGAAEGSEGAKAWRSMGSDLRKIADQFHVEHAKVSQHGVRSRAALPILPLLLFPFYMVCSFTSPDPCAWRSIPVPIILRHTASPTPPSGVPQHLDLGVLRQITARSI